MTQRTQRSPFAFAPLPRESVDRLTTVLVITLCREMAADGWTDHAIANLLDLHVDQVRQALVPPKS